MSANSVPAAPGSAPRGCIDGIDGDTVVGWFLPAPGQSEKLAMRVNGRVVASFGLERARPDVAERFGVGPNTGFACQISDLPKHAVHDVSIEHAASGFDFGGERLRYCPAVPQMRARLRGVFFPEFYRYRHGFEAMTNAEAFEHYVRFGIYADFDPNPWFRSEWFREYHPEALERAELPVIAYLLAEPSGEVRPSEAFDPAFYLASNADLDRREPLLEHYVRHGHREGRVERADPVPQQVLQERGAMVALDPEVGTIGDHIHRVVRYPRLTVSSYVPRLVARRFPTRPKVVVCVPFLSVGGSDLIATYLIRALEEAHGAGNVLTIVTDRAENSVAQWVDAESNVVFLDEGDEITDFGDRIEALHATIGYLAPDRIVNVNSHACWAMYLHFGMQLSTVVELCAYLFCFDYDAAGQRAGYISGFVPRCVPWLKTVYCDNRTVIDEMQALYGFPSRHLAKFHELYTPAPPGLEIVRGAADPANVDKPVLWVGRLARQKRPELLIEIARRMPNRRFVAYGPPGDAGAGEIVMSGEVPNVEYRGVFSNVADLDLDEFSMYLNTSAWEGLPTILIQLMATGLPIVTSNVGGIGELVNYDTGWIAANHGDPASYATEMKQVLLNPEVAAARAARGLELVAERHTWEAYRDRLGALGAFEVPARREGAPVVETAPGAADLRRKGLVPWRRRAA